MDDLHTVLVQQGMSISKNVIHKIKAAGYRFRESKEVLTSTDPEYREKLQKIMQILANLKPDEKFSPLTSMDHFRSNSWVGAP